MIASTLSQDPLEDVAAALGDTPGWFQLYPPNDRELTESLVRRAEAAGYRAIVITLDTLTLGWRPRDLALASFPQLKGLCLANYFSDPVFRSKLAAPPEDDVEAATGLWAMIFGNQSLTWDDLAWLRSLTTLPILLKGICSPDDARRAVDAGMDGIYCSNHGGRQANGGLPALDCLAEVVDAAGDLPVVFDSGVRSGPDVLKALALGASAVGHRPALRLRARGRRPGRHRARRTLPARRAGPDHGHRRLPEHRRPDPRGDPAGHAGTVTGSEPLGSGSTPVTTKATTTATIDGGVTTTPSAPSSTTARRVAVSGSRSMVVHMAPIPIAMEEARSMPGRPAAAIPSAPPMKRAGKTGPPRKALSESEYAAALHTASRISVATE